MSEQIGWIVRSEAGHDTGDVLCVVAVRDDRLLLADGKRRKLVAPKRKKLRHVSVLERGFDHEVIRKLQNSQTVSDRELRSALAAFKGGNHAWQKTI